MQGNVLRELLRDVRGHFGKSVQVNESRWKERHLRGQWENDVHDRISSGDARVLERVHGSARDGRSRDVHGRGDAHGVRSQRCYDDDEWCCVFFDDDVAKCVGGFFGVRRLAPRAAPAGVLRPRERKGERAKRRASEKSANVAINSLYHSRFFQKVPSPTLYHPYTRFFRCFSKSLLRGFLLLFLCFFSRIRVTPFPRGRRPLKRRVCVYTHITHFHR